jgi:hypothetical protein
MAKRELWRTLKVGDKVRLSEYPPEFLRPGYQIHRDTKRVYKRLVARGRPLRVFQIDEYGAPWIHCRIRGKSGRLEDHWLAINHDGLVRVRPRRK